MADYFVICSAFSEPQLRAVRDGIQVAARDELAVRPFRVDGEVGSGWIIMDFTDVIVHILNPEKREYYALETLWNDADEIEWRNQTPEEVIAEVAHSGRKE